MNPDYRGRSRRNKRNRRNRNVRNRNRNNHNSKRTLIGIIIIAVSVLVIMIAATSIFLWRKAAKAVTPEELLLQYMAYIETKNYEQMYEMLDMQSKMNITEEDFISRNQNIYEGIKAKNIKIEITDTGDDKAEKKGTLTYATKMDTMAGEINFDNQAVFIKEKETENGYGLHWNHNLIFPKLSETDKVKTSVVQAKRGSIFDRNSKLLAGPGTASSVGLVPGKMGEFAAENTIALAQLLDTTAESIEKKLSAAWVKDDSFVPIKTIRKLLETDIMSAMPTEDIIQRKALQEALLAIPGVMITDTEVRTYPLNEKGSHLTGYVQNITAEELAADTENAYNANSQIGKVGLESLYEKRLRGKNGSKITILDENGDEKEVLADTPVQDGENIQVTIDSNLQTVLYDQYREDKSTSVAMNPLTGEVLALVSTPAYDSNDFVMGMSTDKWTALNEDVNRPLNNRFRATWSPGSSFKSVIAAIGVTTGKLDPNEDFGASGLSWQKDASWGAYEVTTLHEYENAVLQNALIYSDNIYFAKAALKIGADTLAQQLTDIGFKETMPFAIKMSESSYSNEEAISSEIQLADSGYGQGQLLVNPLHLGVIYSAFVNDGNMIAPYLEYNKETLPTYWKENAFSKEAADTVRQALLQVVEDPHGTAHAAKIEGVKIAGKTGTAEIKASKEDTTGTELGWLISFTTDAQTDKSLMVVTMVEDVKDRGGSGYVVARNKGLFLQN